MSPEYWELIGRGVVMTLWLTVASAALSLAVGLLVGVLRIAPVAALSNIAAAYTEFFRNIPLLTVLFFIYFGVPNTGLRLDAVTSAIIGLGLYTAAYTAEVIRAGLGTVSKGNVEAARSLGMSFIQTLRYVQVPQALRAAIPPLGTLLIALLKNTSLASTITVGELLFQSGFVGDRTFNPDILLIAGAIYIALTLPTGALFNLLEQRWAIKR
ncbi:MAG TPA: amino acid ABC transporter permease [Roseiflexaceae bacterium]|nr:amino acid ABC transporter permease [Roseiflexaceae bacterium]